MDTVVVMSTPPAVTDCPECRGIDTVIFGICTVCFAEFLYDADTPQPWRREDAPLSYWP